MDYTALIAALSVLVWAGVITLASTSLTIIVRNAPVVRGWVQEAKRPWACNICMPLYACAVVAAGLCVTYARWEPALAYLPAYVLTNMLLDKLAEAPGAAPSIALDLPEDSAPLMEVDMEEDLSQSSDLFDTGPHALPPALRTNRKV